MNDFITKKIEETPEYLTRGEVAKLFKLSPDTLINWEKAGYLTPLRVGPRKDRKYRKQDIETIVAKMGSKLTLAQLEQFLWKSADILRGKIDSSDYKKYIFGLLFYKRISDVWDEEYQKVMDEYKDKTLAEADYNHRFQVPIDCKWSVIAETSENIGQKLNDIFDKITNVNSPKLDKIFDDLDFANKDRFPNETIQRLINHFSQYNFGSNYISSDLLGDAYEYLIKQFAADAGKKGGEFYTPREVERIIIGIVKPHQKDHVYDPTVGSGGFLLEAYNYLKDKSSEQVARTLYFYGQEINIGTFAIAKINMFLHGLDSSDIRRGDTLANPQFLNNMGNLQTFDIVVANPPYSIKDWEFELFKNDKYGRTEGYDQPPQKNADYAFVLHILKSMNTNGRAGIVLPHGVLFRGGSEGRIREQIIKNDLLEAVIGLPPKLFYGTGIPAAILIFNRNKPENKKGKVLIIDAERDFLEGKNQNTLRKQDIDKIINAYDKYENIEKYAHVVSVKEIEAEGYDLNVNNYVDSDDVVSQIVIDDVLKELKKLEQEQESARIKFQKLLEKNDTDYNGWKIVKISEICQIINGKTPLRTNENYWKDGDVNWFTIDDIRIQGRFIVNTKQHITQLAVQETGIKVAPKNSVLVCCTASVGEVAFSLVDMATNQQFNSLIVKDISQVLPLYLYYVIFFRSSELKKLMGMTTFGFVSTSKLGNLTIKLPALEKQQKIAEIFSSLDESILKTSQILNVTGVLKNGLMQDIFSQKLQIS